MKKRDAFLKKFLKSGLITDHLIYKGLRNKVKMQPWKVKAIFFLDIIRDAKGNSKRLWKSIDKLTGKEKPEYDSIQLKINRNIQNNSLAVATNFNNYFLNSVQKLGQNFSKICPPHSVVCDSSAFSMTPTSDTKVEKKNPLNLD